MGDSLLILRAKRLLQFGFTLLPIAAGLDKFLHLFTEWEKYLAPTLADILPVSAHAFMIIVGVIEIVAGIIVALKPKTGGLIVCFLLLGITLNLIIAQSYYDIALRDFGLAIGALSLWSLSKGLE